MKSFNEMSNQELGKVWKEIDDIKNIRLRFHYDNIGIYIEKVSKLENETHSGSMGGPSPVEIEISHLEQLIEDEYTEISLLRGTE